MTSPNKSHWGKSDHEMLQEIYGDVKEIRENMSSYVTWKGLGGIAATIATLTVAILNLAT